MKGDFAEGRYYLRNIFLVVQLIAVRLSSEAVSGFRRKTDMQRHRFAEGEYESVTFQVRWSATSGINKLLFYGWHFIGANRFFTL